MDFALTLWGIATPTIFETIIDITIKVLLVIAGINALIIVHEFGHFIVARMCGVRCEKFYIWFDFWGLKFFKFKWGNTEYGLGMFPLGGYVKMLGQEDNPGELKAEMERAKAEQTKFNTTEQDTNQQNETTTTTQITETRSVESLTEAIFAPDSYLSKSVPQRLAIIVAGVLMNFIFAIICATGAYLVGIKDTAPIAGNIVPGSPAWEAGLETGDHIKSINGRTARAFMDINMAAVDGANGVSVTFDRIVNGQTQSITKNFKPRKRPNDIAPMFGVNGCAKLELEGAASAPIDTIAKKYYAKETIEKLKQKHLVITAVDGKDVATYSDYLNASFEKWGKPITITFAEKLLDQDKYECDMVPPEPFTAIVPAIPLREVGLRFRMGEIASVHPESNAAKKGIQVGDTILAVDDVTDFDPMKLAYIILQKVNAGQKTVKLKIQKKHAGTPAVNNSANTKTTTEPNTKTETETATSAESLPVASESAGVEVLEVGLQPIRIIPQVSALSMQDPLGSSALGLAWNVKPVVDGYLPDATAEAKKIPVGSKIISVKFVNSIPLLNRTSFTYTEKDGFVFHKVGDRVELPYIFDCMLQGARTPEQLKDADKINTDKNVSVQLEVIKPDGLNTLFLLPVYDSSQYFRLDRGLLLSAEQTIIKIDNIGDAFSLGVAKTVEYSLAVYVTLKRFYDGKVSPRALGGPVLIVQSAYSFVARGYGAYLLFLCVIGANLAVVNLLPMPPLDGGHVVFLLYEGIFRRPPNIIVQVILSYLGLALILLLALWVIALDVSFIPRF
ncbi:MAG: site-2 protease family protein [Planctomycetaceae bacterium]|jgi:regulator of sigma E protease|nr:site-2 protease family protein [Planctomycetaceae bacterium]